MQGRTRGEVTGVIVGIKMRCEGSYGRGCVRAEEGGEEKGEKKGENRDVRFDQQVHLYMCVFGGGGGQRERETKEMVA